MNKGRASVRALTSDFPGALLLKTLEAVPDLLLWQELDSREIVTLLSCFPDAPIAKTFRAYQVSTVFAASGSTLFLHGAPTSSGASAGLHNGSATRKYKCLWALLELLHRMRARTPGGRTLLGLFLEIAHRTHSHSSESEKIVIAWHRPASRDTFTARRSDRDTAPFFVPLKQSDGKGIRISSSRGRPWR